MDLSMGSIEMLRVARLNWGEDCSIFAAKRKLQIESRKGVGNLILDEPPPTCFLRGHPSFRSRLSRFSQISVPSHATQTGVVPNQSQ